jgi:hypothetical protein
MRPLPLFADAEAITSVAGAYAPDDEQAPERELDGLLLAFEPGAVRVRRQPRLTLDAHFRAVATETPRRWVSAPITIICTSLRWDD